MKTGNEHATGAVQAAGATVANHQLVSGLRIAMVLLGVMIALPAFVMGANLTHTLGVRGATIASFAGGAILALVALPAAIAGTRSRQTTYILIQEAFGLRGGLVVNGIIVVAIVGWFGVIAMMFGQAFRSTLPDSFAHFPVQWLALIGCLLMAVITVIGFRALDLLSAVASPLKVIVLVWTLVESLKSMHLSAILSVPPAGGYSIASGISIVVGGIMTGATLAPDISRFARTPTHAALGCGLAYGLAFPIVLMLSGIPSIASGQQDLVVTMLALGLGIPAMIAVLLIALTTNGYNLYAASLILATAAPRRPHWQLATLACAVGTIAGLAGISEKMTPFLIVLSVCIPPVAGVYLCNFYLGSFFGQRSGSAAWRPESFVAWIMGSGFAFFADRIHVVITSIPALDSLVISGACYLLLRWTAARLAAGKAIKQRSV